MKHFKIAFAALFWSILWMPSMATDKIYEGANAQNFVKGASIVKINSVRNTVDFVKLSSFEKINEASGISWLTSDVLKAGQDYALRLLKTETDKTGYYHHRYEQYYKGFKVEYGVYNLHC